ncbi:MAG: hypothetical protein KDM63_08055 [Verrucomicrobiae bacterium]|nr:hypothetical protein [Verrucomicrobiae bacterium]
MAVRYDQKKKDEVVAFITEYNKANGRGGQSVASKKFGITPLTIGKWLKNAGVKKGGRKGSVPAAPAKKGRGRGKAKGGTSGINAVFQRMIKIREQIEQLEAEFEDLKNQL